MPGGSVTRLDRAGTPTKRARGMTGINIIFVDDENEFLSNLAETFQGRGMNVLTATSGDEALQIMKGMPINVVVLDVFMPGKGGIQTLREMRRAFPETEVLLLSGMADLETAVAGMKSGAFDYLVKPVNIDELETRVREACRRRELVGNLAKAKSVS